MAQAHRSTRLWKNHSKTSVKNAIDRHELFGANLDSSDDLQIYRGDGQNDKGLKINVADTTNNTIGLEVLNTGTGNAIFVDMDGNGVALNIDGEETTANAVNVAVDALTTGLGVNISSSATAITGAGRLLYVNHSGATSTSGIVAEIITAATDETVPLKVSTSGTGAAIQLEGGPVLEDQETLTAAAPAAQTWGASSIDSSSNAVDATLADAPGGASAVGQLKSFVMTEASNSSTVTIASHETEDSEVATFDAVDEYWLGIWTGTEWATVSATCTFV